MLYIDIQAKIVYFSNLKRKKGVKSLFLNGFEQILIFLKGL